MNFWLHEMCEKVLESLLHTHSISFTRRIVQIAQGEENLKEEQGYKDDNYRFCLQIMAPDAFNYRGVHY